MIKTVTPPEGFNTTKVNNGKSNIILVYKDSNPSQPVASLCDCENNGLSMVNDIPSVDNNDIGKLVFAYNKKNGKSVGFIGYLIKIYDKTHIYRYRISDTKKEKDEFFEHCVLIDNINSFDFKLFL